MPRKKKDRYLTAPELEAAIEVIPYQDKCRILSNVAWVLFANGHDKAGTPITANIDLEPYPEELHMAGACIAQDLKEALK